MALRAHRPLAGQVAGLEISLNSGKTEDARLGENHLSFSFVGHREGFGTRRENPASGTGIPVSQAGGGRCSLFSSSPNHSVLSLFKGCPQFLIPQGFSTVSGQSPCLSHSPARGCLKSLPHHTPKEKSEAVPGFRPTESFRKNDENRDPFPPGKTMNTALTRGHLSCWLVLQEVGKESITENSCCSSPQNNLGRLVWHR